MKARLLSIALCLLTGVAGAEPAFPGLAQQSSPGATAPRPASGSDRVHITKIRLRGGDSLLTPQEIEAAVAPFEGRDLSIAELQNAANALTELLKSKGHFLARAILPVQELTSGELQLEVLEGSIDQINVEGNEYYSAEFIKNHLEDGLGPGRTLDEATLQRKLLLLNDNLDLNVQAVLEPSVQEGKADVTLQVKDNLPLHAGVNYDNFGTQFTNIHRVGPHFTVGNVLQQGDAFNAHYLLGMPDNRASFFQASYSSLLDDDGTRFTLGYANGASTLGQQLQVLDIRGKANIYSASVVMPLVRSLTERQELSLSYSYKDINNSLLGALAGVDKYHSLRVGFNGDWADESGHDYLRVALTQGLGGDSLIGPIARTQAAPAFTKLNLDLTRVHYIDDPFFFVFRGSGQYTRNTLYAAEQFALGGIDSVRGYPQSQFLGDVGYNLSAEARWIPFEDRRDVQFSAFLDHGGATILRPQPGQLASQILTGAGLGLRFELGSSTQMRVDVGWPLFPGRNSSGDKPVFYGQIFTNF